MNQKKNTHILAQPSVQRIGAHKKKEIDKKLLKEKFYNFSNLIQQKIDHMKSIEIQKFQTFKRHNSQILTPVSVVFDHFDEENNSDNEESYDAMDDFEFNEMMQSRTYENKQNRSSQFFIGQNHDSQSHRAHSQKSNLSDIGNEDDIFMDEDMDISDIIIKRTISINSNQGQPKLPKSKSVILTSNDQQQIQKQASSSPSESPSNQSKKNKKNKGKKTENYLLSEISETQELEPLVGSENNQQKMQRSQSKNEKPASQKEKEKTLSYKEKSSQKTSSENLLDKKKPVKVKSNKQKEADVKKKKFQWTIFKRMLKYTKREWKLNVISFIFMLGQAGTNMYIPKLSGELLDSTSKWKDLDRLNHFAMIAIFVYVANAIFDFARTFCYHLLGEKIVNALRNDCFKKFILADIEFHDKTPSGELLSRLSSDISIAKSAVSGNLGTLIRNIVTSLGNLVILLYMSWQLSISIFVCVPLFIVSSGYCVNQTKRLQRKYQKFLAKITQYSGECFQNIRTIKAFSTEDKEVARFNKKAQKAYKHGFEQSFSQGLGNGTESLFLHFATLAVLWYGGYLVLNTQTLTSGQLAAFLMYTGQLASSATNISQCIQKIQTATGACDRLFEMMDIKPTISLKTGKKLPKYKVKIIFKDVSFQYPSTPDVKILNKFNLTIDPGDQIAFVGSSGSGKSTIIRLIERFYDTSSGQVTIDRVDIKDIDVRDWRNQVGYVQQEPILFSGTIEQNITYGVLTCTQDELDEACKQASAYDFIHNTKIFPLGYKTNVGEAGNKLSGGQKQRIAIARALLRQPKVLIFDEATSALDAESEFQVQQAIDELMIKQNGKLTILIIAHRLSTIANCQRIVALHQGEIVEQGSYQQLLNNNGFFKALVERQLNQKIEQ